jgi:hypothetical protein
LPLSASFVTERWPTQVEVLAAEVTSVPLLPAFTTDLVPFTQVLFPNLFPAKTLGAG